MKKSISQQSPRPMSTGYQVFMLVLCAYALIALAVGTVVKFSPHTNQILSYADVLLCIAFFADFVVSLVSAPNRWRYLYTWGWIDLLSSIPTFPALRWGRLVRIVRIVRVLRGVRAARTVSTFIFEKRAQSAFLAAALLSILCVFLGSIVILEVETVPSANIHEPKDAVWWAFETVTSINYGDLYPVTTEGRVVAAVLVVVGAALFGALAGSAAVWFLAPSRKEEESEIAQLRKEIGELRRSLETRKIE